VTAHSKSGTLEIIAQYALLAGILVLILGLTSYFKSEGVAVSVKKSSLTERDIAIKNATDNNRQTYSFDSRFTPGIGYIGNPEQYLKNWQDQHQLN
jgi:hypothetical protein